LKEYFADDIERGIGMFFGGKIDASAAPLEIEDEMAFNMAWAQLIRNLQKVAPQVVPDIAAQYNTFKKWAQIAKATLPSTGGVLPLAYPSRTGAIGVYPIFPQALKYPAVSGYNAPVTLYDGNTWDVQLTKPAAAGTNVGDFLFGSSGAFHRTSNAPNKRQLLVIAQNGFIEIGTTPNIIQFQVEGEAEAGKYSFFATSPLQDLSSDPRRPVYIYETPYQIAFWHNFGMRIRVVSKATYKASLRLIGLVFFEHELFPTTIWV
jgi:hypothetical protein